MNKIFFGVLCAALMFSCSSKRDDQFCNCLDASEKLNKASKAMLNNSQMDLDKVTELNDLRTKKEKACAAYTKLTAEESKELREACED
jgi:hypothetical protein